MAEVDLGRALQSFTRSAWRLESLAQYSSPGDAEALKAWRAGRTPRNEAWLALLAEHIRAGHRVGRVHALTTPLTDYLRFELAAYQASVEAGETVGIADREQHPELNVDFWLFDDRRVAVMHYDDSGRFLGATDGTHKLDHYRRLRDVADAAAVPLSDWTHTLAD